EMRAQEDAAASFRDAAAQRLEADDLDVVTPEPAGEQEGAIEDRRGEGEIMPEEIERGGAAAQRALEIAARGGARLRREQKEIERDGIEQHAPGMPAEGQRVPHHEAQQP